MDNQRIILFLALAIVVLFMWDAWEKKNHPQPVVQQTVNSQPPATPTEATSPDSNVVTNDMPEVATKQSAAELKTPAQSATMSGQRVQVVTDVLDVDLDTIGGDLRRALMLKYPISLADKEPFPFMNDKLPKLFIAQSGFLSNADAPDHRSKYTTAITEYHLANGQDELRVPLVWQSDQDIYFSSRELFG